MRVIYEPPHTELCWACKYSYGPLPNRSYSKWLSRISLYEAILELMESMREFGKRDVWYALGNRRSPEAHSMINILVKDLWSHGLIERVEVRGIKTLRWRLK